MANLIDKSTDLRVWGYWRTINLIGNFDANPDPIVRDNIMLSAYLAEQINAYEAATGSTRFDEPGSLTFVWKDGRTFAYDHHRIVEAVAPELRRQRARLLPVRAGLGVHRLQHPGRPSAQGPRHAPRHRLLGPDGGPLAPHRRGRDAHARRQPARTSGRRPPGCPSTPARCRAASTSSSARTASSTSPPTWPSEARSCRCARAAPRSPHCEG